MIILVHVGHDFLRLIPRNEMEIFSLNQEYIFLNKWNYYHSLHVN